MRGRVWLGFAGFCLLSGSTWLRGYLLPTAWPELLQIAVHDGAVCGLLVLVWLVRREPRADMRGTLGAGLWCAVLFVLVPVLGAGAAGHVAAGTQVLIVALVPAATVLLESQSESAEPLAGLLPALAGLGGLALLVPFTTPHGAAGGLWSGLLGAGAVLLGFAGVRLHGMLHGLRVVPVAAVGSGLAALFCSLLWRLTRGDSAALSRWGAELLWGVAVDGALILLTVWLVREMTPAGFAGRMVLVPWVTLVGSLVVMRVRPGWISVAGLALALGGSVLLARVPDAIPTGLRD